MSDKREDYLSWDEYFMAVAVLAGMRSKDPNTQVGACIVSERDSELPRRFPGRSEALCDAVSVQRMRESDHSGGNPDSRL